MDPFVFEYVMSEGLGLDFARVEFNKHAPPSIVEDEPYGTNGNSVSDYCRLVQVVQSMPPIDDIRCDFDLGIKLSSGPYNGSHYKLILYTDHIKWCHLVLKKDLHLELLRWYLLVQEFDFEVCDKGKLGEVGEPIDKLAVHYLCEPTPS